MWIRSSKYYEIYYEVKRAILSIFPSLPEVAITPLFIGDKSYIFFIDMFLPNQKEKEEIVKLITNYNGRILTFQWVNIHEEYLKVRIKNVNKMS